MGKCFCPPKDAEIYNDENVHYGSTTHNYKTKKESQWQCDWCGFENDGANVICASCFQNRKVSNNVVKGNTHSKGWSGTGYSLIGNDNINKNQITNSTSIEAKNSAAIAAQNRMQSLTKSPKHSKKPNALTQKKKKMVSELDAIDQRQNELDQIRQKRIEKG
eukprot:860366_1